MAVVLGYALAHSAVLGCRGRELAASGVERITRDVLPAQDGDAPDHAKRRDVAGWQVQRAAAGAPPKLVALSDQEPYAQEAWRLRQHHSVDFGLQTWHEHRGLAQSTHFPICSLNRAAAWP